VGNQTKGTPVDRVELSFDSGKTWILSNIREREMKNPGAKVFSWVLWEHTIDARHFLEGTSSSNEGTIRVTCKCTDVEGTTQDKTID